MKTASPLIDIHTHHPGPHPGLIRIRNLFYQDYLASGLPDQPVSVGLHPWHCDSVVFDKNRLAKASADPRVWALGECGLDRLCEVEMETQRKVFFGHCELAEQWRLPLIIHQVRSADALLQIRKEFSPTVPWIIHGFRGKPKLALQLLEAGFYLSFGSALCQEDSALHDSLFITPTDRLFLETDESDLPIEQLYEQAAKVLLITSEELAARVFTNFKTVFTRYATN